MNLVQLWLTKPRPRELVLAAVVLLLLVGFVVLRNWLLPAYDDWTASRAMAEARRVEHTKLINYLKVRDSVESQYATLDPPVFQHDSDQITLSRFLKRIEALARQPGMTIVSAKPQAPESYGVYRRFPIHLSVAGSLPEVTRFAVELLNSSDVVGLKSFSLRGVQGGQEVECTLVVWMVSLKPLDDHGRDTNKAVASISTRGSHHE